MPEPGKRDKRHHLADGEPAHWRLDATAFARSRRVEEKHARGSEAELAEAAIVQAAESGPILVAAKR
jgi:hypothetical protein